MKLPTRRLVEFLAAVRTLQLSHRLAVVEHLHRGNQGKSQLHAAVVGSAVHVHHAVRLPQRGAQACREELTLVAADDDYSRKDAHDGTSDR